MSDPIGRDEFNARIEGLRHEVNAGITAAGIQIGAVEKTLVEKLRGVKVWGAAAIIGGQSLAALISSAVGGPTPTQTAKTAVAVIRHLV